MRGWQLSDIEKLSSRGFSVNVAPIPKDRVIIPRQEAKEVVWMHWNLLYWCNKNALELEKEYRFDSKRFWRFDFAIKSLKIAIEFEGIFSVKNRHTSFKGYTGDTDKYNAASAQGWKVLRYTNLNYKDVLQDLGKILSSVLLNS